MEGGGMSGSVNIGIPSEYTLHVDGDDPVTVNSNLLDKVNATATVNGNLLDKVSATATVNGDLLSRVGATLNASAGLSIKELAPLLLTLLWTDIPLVKIAVPHRYKLAFHILGFEVF